MPAQTRNQCCGTEVADSDRSASTSLHRQGLIDALHQAYCREMRDLYQQETADQQDHAPFLLCKIATWEGEPTTEPGPSVPYVDQPRETPEELLEHALASAE